jgi:single-strand DNA-binding protein
MAYFNRITMIGNLTRDPEVKQSRTGLTLCSFGVASNRSFKNKQSGEMEKDVCFVDVNFWGNNAEYFGQALKKGREVLLEGRLKFNTWQDQSGAKHAKHLIIADRLIPMYPNPEQTVNLDKSPSSNSVASTTSNHNTTQFSASNMSVADGAIEQRCDLPTDLPF